MILKNLLAFLLLCINAFKVIAQDGHIDFVKNKNQFPKQVLFKADLPGGAVFLTQDGFTYNYFKQSDLAHIHDLMHKHKKVDDEVVHYHAYQVSFANANNNTSLSEEGLQPYYNNYFLGNDPKNWAGHVPLYKKIIWHNIYNNIDAVVYSRGTSLKYDFVIQPDGDVSKITLDYKGAQPQITGNGALHIHTSVNEITEEAPYAYQVVDGRKVTIACNFKKSSDGKISFEFPKGYNKSLALTIDPILIFSTFSGSVSTTYGFSATYDAAGDLYAGGESFGVGWPVSVGAFLGSFSGAVDAGINKYNSTGTIRLYSTYYGGSNTDLPNNMIVNAQEELVICGSTNSPNLPMTGGCYDNTQNGQNDIYIARFSVDGSVLKAATYLGGSGDDGDNSGFLSPNYGDEHRGEVFTSSNGNIFIANSSSSTNFPTATNAFQPANAGAQDAVVCELDSNLSTLIYSTYLGGSADDAAFSLVLNSNNQVVICGGTVSGNFPVTAGSYITTPPGGTNGFVSILNTSGGLLHSTFLGTASYDHAFKIQKDELDNIFVLGQTDYNSNYPVTPGAYSIANGNIFISKLNPTLSTLMASTRMGNNSPTFFVPTAFMHDICGNTYFSGFNAAISSPLSANAYQTTPGGFWLGALGPDFTSLVYGTFFGPQGTHVDGGTSRFDPSGIIYHSACTADPSFPTTPGVVAPVKLSPDWDIASYKFDMLVGAVHADFELANNENDTGCADYHVDFHNLSTGATNYYWTFGDGGTSTSANPSHAFATGSYTITLIATRTTGCILADTATMNIYVKPTLKPLLHLRDTFICDAIALTLNANVSNPNMSFQYHWEPVGAITSNPNQEQVTVNTALSTVFTVYVQNTSPAECIDSSIGVVHVNLNDYSNMIAMPVDTSICPGDTVLLRAIGGPVSWSPDEKMDNAHMNATLVWPGRDIVYVATITNDSGCSINRNVHIGMLPPEEIFAGEDQDIKRGETAQIHATAGGPFYWMPPGLINPGTSLNPIVQPDQTTTYFLYSNSKEGCKAMDSVTIHVTNAMLPNAFSPNGDGVNDFFKLSIQDERVHLKDFSVFNRWGQKVFFTKIITEGWDGTYNNKPADLDTYFYFVHYIIGEKTYTLKGDVTLIR